MNTTPSSALPRFALGSVRDAAESLAIAATESGADPFHALPFNRFKPDNTFWWLVPSAENPAYKYGKVALASGPLAAPGDVFVGLHVEKGIGESAADAFRDTAHGRRLTMDRTWLWHPFMRAVRSGTISEEAAAAETAAGWPLTIAIDAGIENPSMYGDDGVRGEGWEPDLVRFEFSGGQLRVIDADTRAGLLTPLATADTFPAVAAGLQAIPSADWVWVDVLIGLRFAATGESPEQPAWSADAVWRQACLPWKAWLK